MGEQQDLKLKLGSASFEKYKVPEKREYPPVAYTPHPEGAQLKPDGVVTLIHRLGSTKQVRFAQVTPLAAWVIWPVSNDQVAISLETGYCVSPKSTCEWRLEPSALRVARASVGIGYVPADSTTAVDPET